MITPFMIAVSGGSGSGKTTFVNRLRSRLEIEQPLVISIDHYYRDLSHLTPEERRKCNFDDPDSIERDLLHEQVSLLRNGVAVDRPCYSFSTHTRTREVERLEPSSIILVDGIFALCFPELLRLFDLKLFIDVDHDVRLVRRIRRDMAERGRSFEDCADQYLGTVKAMHEKFIEPTKRSADFVVPWQSINERAIAYMARLVTGEVAEKRQFKD
ncbi:MAG: uridine kinase [Oligoflexus sp.]|jgi:uridine kinase